MAKLEGEVTVSKEKYLSLRLAYAELQRLEEYGVDNWAGRDDAYEGWNEEVEGIEKEIKEL